MGNWSSTWRSLTLGLKSALVPINSIQPQGNVAWKRQLWIMVCAVE